MCTTMLFFLNATFLKKKTKTTTIGLYPSFLRLYFILGFEFSFKHNMIFQCIKNRKPNIFGTKFTFHNSSSLGIVSFNKSLIWGKQYRLAYIVLHIKISSFNVFWNGPKFAYHKKEHHGIFCFELFHWIHIDIDLPKILMLGQCQCQSNYSHSFR